MNSEIDTPDTPPAVARLNYIRARAIYHLDEAEQKSGHIFNEADELRDGLREIVKAIDIPLEPAVPAGRGEAKEVDLPPLRCISREQYLAETSSAFDAAVKKRAAENPSTPPARDLEADEAVCNEASPAEEWPDKYEEVTGKICDDLEGWRAVGPLHDYCYRPPEVEQASRDQAGRDQLFARTARVALPFWLHEVRRLRAENAELRSRPQFASIQAVLPPGVQVIRPDKERVAELEAEVGRLQAENDSLRSIRPTPKTVGERLLQWSKLGRKRVVRFSTNIVRSRDGEGRVTYFGVQVYEEGATRNFYAVGKDECEVEGQCWERVQEWAREDERLRPSHQSSA